MIIAFLTLFIPGELLALALLRKTKLSLFEISVFGFIIGLIAPATLTWIEAYAVNYIHAFSFSLGLFEWNAVLLSVVGFILCVQQGVISISTFGKTRSRSKEVREETNEIRAREAEYRKDIGEIRSRLSRFEAAKAVINSHVERESMLAKRQEAELQNVSSLTAEERETISDAHKREMERIIKDHEQEELALLNRLERDPDIKVERGGISLNLSKNWVWVALLLIILVGFSIMLLSIAVAPNYFEFDPYFDMLAAKSILVFGHQFYNSSSAWPVKPAGTVTRIQPLIPYLEAYWYSLAGFFGANISTFNTSLMSYVGGVYPPIAGALLAFVVFILLYYEYDKYIALIGATLVILTPILITTSIAGEQLLESWGIFSLFLFFATYSLAIKNMDNKRYAILAGLAFASTFLGAHYYTVDAGVLALYIVIQGIVSVFRHEDMKPFYKMNAIVLSIIAIFLIIYHPYHATLSGRIPNLLGIPITLSFPLFALVLVALFEYIPVILSKRHIIFNRLDNREYLEWFILLAVLIIIMIVATPVGKPIKSYLALSKKFTTPSSPLFMTVQEYASTGIGFNFYSGGFGLIGANIFGIPILVWGVVILSFILILISIIFRNSKTGILYLAIAAPLLVAAISEVKYLPHFAVVYIILLGILLGEVIYIIKNGRYWESGSKHGQNTNSLVYPVLSLGIFFISPILAMAFLLFVIFTNRVEIKSYSWALFALFLIIFIAGIFVNHTIMIGAVKSFIGSFSAMFTYSANPSAACAIFSNNGNGMGTSLYCNTIPEYWINATNWMRTNIGPYAPRILAWWDYGDWINWFGNSNAVLRGDNSVPAEDYATAASFVLGPKYGFGPSTLSTMMNGNQSEYLLLDNQLVPKWGALDFLACIDINATSEAYAISQAKAQNASSPYLLGTSNCEVTHDPQYALIPLSTLVQNISSSSLSNYCTLNTSTPYARTLLVNGFSLSNETVCVDPQPTSSGVFKVYDTNGTQLNAVLPEAYDQGVVTIQGSDFVEFLVVYTPNSKNGTITDAPSQFYDSNYYRGFFLGDLPGFTQVYPIVNQINGTNYVNYTDPLRIFKLDNYTGGIPTQIPTKPSYVKNNYTMP